VYSGGRRHLALLPRRDESGMEAHRLAAVPRGRRGEPLAAIARALGVGRQAVHKWAQQYRRRGAAGLRRRPRPGRPPKLARAQLAQLLRLVVQGAEAYGFPTPVWTPAISPCRLSGDNAYLFLAPAFRAWASLWRSLATRTYSWWGP